MIIHRAIALFSLSLAAVSLTACVAPADDEGELGYADEETELAEAESAVGEVGCRTVAPDATGDVYHDSLSPNTTYDHGPDCPGQYVVEYANIKDTNTAFYTFGNGWGESLPTTAAGCNWLQRTEIGIYTKKNGVWQPTFTEKFRSRWSGGSCSMENEDGDPSPFIDHDVDTIRLAIKAYYNSPLPCNVWAGCKKIPAKALASVTRF